MSRIFITGASGYIGGQVLHDLTAAHPDLRIRALVRSEQSAKAISAAFPNIETVSGDLDNAAVITEEVKEADIVLHLAATGHLKSVQTIHEALRARSANNPAYWIQISGASALAAAELADSSSHVPGSASDAVFDDLDGVSDIISVIRAHPSRAVDNYVLDVAAAAGTNTPQVNTALVFPGIIYGPGQGPGNQRSIQIPSLADAVLKRGRGVQVGRGLSRWANVHVQDVGALFVALVEKAIAPRAAKDAQLWNTNGLYLTGVGEMPFKEISRAVARAAAAKGFIADGDIVDEVPADEADQALPHGRVLYGTNARGEGRRARELLGWSPRFGKTGLDEEIPRAVDEAAKSHGKA
ncbi:hypothetical protein JDV02_004708 [Purpureocillium takamizusanense]|uniref:NAD-dependent epimerase/dehydratase domain-containing protein n=1 Tax=Purpureocillium takamizusanense TaxID=2060973 RepID=A0A9Q8V9N2_9HYPO|nr:uncharacterized protein JDV02_004708 [Purpureocillium takamizusanense]UNI18440.1 hypothetical protein JDV02_004708 [Purpureocillium takamizusanense]